MDEFTINHLLIRVVSVNTIAAVMQPADDRSEANHRDVRGIGSRLSCFRLLAERQSDLRALDANRLAVMLHPFRQLIVPQES